MILGIINYIILLALTLWLLLFYHNYAVFVIFVVAALYPVFSAVVSFVISRYLSVQLNISQKSVAKNHDINLEIGVNNKSIFSHDNIELKLKVYNSFYDNEEIITIYVPATALEKRIINWKIKSRYSGLVIVRIISVRVRDFSGMFSFTCKTEATADIIVMPENKKIDKKLEVLSDGDGSENQTQNKKGTDVSEISDIREYVAGDKQQQIHWKISAKWDKLMVKEYGMPYTNELMLVPELYFDGENPKPLDETIDVLYSYAYELLRENRIFYVGYINALTSETSSLRIESVEDLDVIVKQMFYTNISNDPKFSYNYFKGIGRYEGKSIVYIKEAVISCLS